MPAICRACGALPSGLVAACTACGSPGILAHPELETLAVAHVDCDAFFASIEKRDDARLRDRPVIVGGGHRGVVTTACYIARLRGVASAMPMALALRLCPDAAVVRPNFAKYVDAARALRTMMDALTPDVLPLSIDEAALDLSGTQALHGAPPASVLVRFARRVERELGFTVSVGLARNRMLAKIAAARDKPRGFSLLGADAAAVLASEPVSILPGVGPVETARLKRFGILRVGDLQSLSPEAARRLGGDGPALAARARGESAAGFAERPGARSVSAETTLDRDERDPAVLERHLWRVAETLGRRLRADELAAGTVVLKLKTAAFQRRSRAQSLARPTALSDTLWEAGRRLLTREADGTAFRLVGLGAVRLQPRAAADGPDLADPEAARRAARQAALDMLRERFGEAAPTRGRGLAIS